MHREIHGLLSDHQQQLEKAMAYGCRKQATCSAYGISRVANARAGRMPTNLRRPDLTGAKAAALQGAWGRSPTLRRSQRRQVLFINEVTVSLHWLFSLLSKRLPSISAAFSALPE
jgi:hypothetical protein